jgi:hypothetical protein
VDVGTIAAIVGASLGGGGGIVALVRIAVGSETRRANDWREIARTATEAATRNGEHVRELVTAVNQLAAAQRESLAILQAIQAERLGRTRDALLITPPPELGVAGSGAL